MKLDLVYRHSKKIFLYFQSRNFFSVLQIRNRLLQNFRNIYSCHGELIFLLLRYSKNCFCKFATGYIYIVLKIHNFFIYYAHQVEKERLVVMDHGLFDGFITELGELEI